MDLYLFNLINQFAGKWSWLDTLAVFLAEYFEYFLIVFLLLFLLLRFKTYWKTVLGALISAVLARLIIVNFIRWIWLRPRPFIENNVNLLLEYPDKAAFPSGHAAFYFAISTVVFCKNKEAGVLFFAGTILICLARVFAGIHWPTDILAGTVVGVLSGWLVFKIFKKV